MSHEHPKVSVVVPVFNGERYLKETLQSIIQSDYPNYEVILVDDGSKDRSGEIGLETLRCSNVPHLFFSKENSGEADTVNFGFARCTGEFAVIVSADDTIEKSLISESVMVLQQNPGAVVTYPNWNIIDQDSGFAGHIRPLDFSLDLLVGDLLCLPGPGSMIRVSAVKPGKLRDPGLKLISDLDQWLYLSTKGDFVHIDKTLANWRKHSEQQTATGRGKAAADELLVSVWRFFSSGGLSSSVSRLERQSKSMALYRAATESLYSARVQGRVLLIRSLLKTFIRKTGVPKSRRNIFVIGAIALNPFGRIIFLKRN